MRTGRPHVRVSASLARSTMARTTAPWLPITIAYRSRPALPLIPVHDWR
jgi:hypothetical protein